MHQSFITRENQRFSPSHSESRWLVSQPATPCARARLANLLTWITSGTSVSCLPVSTRPAPGCLSPFASSRRGVCSNCRVRARGCAAPMQRSVSRGGYTRQAALEEGFLHNQLTNADLIKRLKVVSPPIVLCPPPRPLLTCCLPAHRLRPRH